MKTKIVIVAVVSLLSTLVAGYYYSNVTSNVTLPNSVTAEQLTKYKESDLKAYNGTDSNQPIYIGLNGYVYDVTAGKQFYITGGTYHYLAGRDSSKELNLIGGDIIKRKYPIVGILVQ